MKSFEDISHADFVTQAAVLYDGYIPAPEVIDHTKHVDVTTVTGPAGVGKDTSIQATHLPQVVSDTTRDMRVNNGKPEVNGQEYHFRGHEFTTVLADIKSGQYVQWDLNPGNGHLYGSRNIAYPRDGGPALIDVMADSVPKLRNIAEYFGSLASIYLVAQDYEHWRERLSGRGELDDNELEGRLREALGSLEFGLEDPGMHFILNKSVDETSKAMRLVAERNYELHSPEDKRARRCGHLMLRGLRDHFGLAQSI